MKLFLMFFFLIGFSAAIAQTKTSILSNFNPSSLGSEVITLAIHADQQTKSDKITYVKNYYGNDKYSIVGYGTDDKLAYVSTNKMGVAKSILVDYYNYTKNGDGESQNSLVGECTWCACVKACAIQCHTNWCNIACLIGCIP